MEPLNTVTEICAMYLERSSARETTVRVAAGAVAKVILSQLGVKVGGHVMEIGGVKAKKSLMNPLKNFRKNRSIICSMPQMKRRVNR